LSGRNHKLTEDCFGRNYEQQALSPESKRRMK